ncbi:MAG: hypothetical protein ACLR8Y_19175 [Alistipes indistinctus]
MVRNIALLTGGDSSEWQIALQGAENIEKRPRPQPLHPLHHCPAQRALDLHSAGRNKESELDRNDSYPARRRPENQTRLCPDRHSRHPGEDGRLQGYLDMMGIPYSSCGFVSSVLTFDKAACKRAVAGSGIHLAKEILLNKTSEIDPQPSSRNWALPLFVKPNAKRQRFRCHQGQETK